MVLGLGTDLIEIERIQASIDQFGDRFLNRIFTEGEIAYRLRKKKHFPAESFCRALCRQGGWRGKPQGQASAEA